MKNRRKLLLTFHLALLACLGNALVQTVSAGTAQLALSNGWNLVSLPLQPTNTHILNVLAPIQGTYQSVWTYSGGHWFGFNPDVPGLNDLTTMQAGKAYWIQMKTNSVLTVNGLPSVNGPNTLYGQSLTPGWNLLGYSSGLAEDATDAFALTAGQLDLAAEASSTGWLWYRPGNTNASTLTSVTPFRGVWAHVTNTSKWLAPNYRGTLLDTASGKPIAGATVSLDGIEAEAQTDSQGNFTVAGISDDPSQLLSAVRPGYTPMTITLDLSAKSPSADGTPGWRGLQTVPLGLGPSPPPFVADVLTPQNNSVWVVPDSCLRTGMKVNGYTALNNQSNFLYDIVFVIDTSASTADLTGFDSNGDGREDTVFEAEVEACRRLAQTFTDTNHTRFGIVKFARYHTKNAPDGYISDGPVIPGETRIVQSLTNSPASFQAALNTVVSEGAVGGTHTAAGIDLAVQALTQTPPVGNDFHATPVRHIVLLTDGIPTLPIESGSTQERGDRVATIEAAQRAAATNIFIHAVVIDPSSATERKLTTMPAVQAITGVPGDPIRVNSHTITNLAVLLSQLALTSIPAVTVHDLTSQAVWNIPVAPNGWFQAILPVALGTNNWEFVFSSGDVVTNQTITELISFVVYPPHSVIDVVSLTSSNPPVTLIPRLVGPTGAFIKDDGSEYSLRTVLTNKTPQARVLPGVESFRSLSGTMTLEFIFKGAGYNSDVGYFLYDPVNPPQSAAEVLVGLTQTNIFLNSGSVPYNSLSVTGFVNTLHVSAGVAVGLFMVPNGHLADAQAGRGNAPLFTLASLNPGQFDQALTFYDPVGHQIVCAFEDIDILSQHADQDFQDLVFTVKPVDPMPQCTECLSP